MVPKINRVVFREFARIAFGVIAGATVLAASALAQLPVRNPMAPREVSAKWTNADSVAVRWEAPEEGTITFYQVYTDTGNSMLGMPDTWALVRSTTSTSAQFSLADLKLAQARTISFVVKSALITLGGDTLLSFAGNIAVAEWENEGGEESLRFTSEPVRTAVLDSLYTYHAVAVSNDSTAIITYSLVKGPDGMAIDSATGVVTWKPLNSGIYEIELGASDNHGNTARQEYTITVGGGEREFTNVRGTVTDAVTGNGIDNARVTFTLGDSTLAKILFSTETNDNGAFDIFLPAGSYIVRAEAKGYVTTYLGNTDTLPGTLLSVVLNVKDTVAIKMQPLPHGTLAGRVTNALTGNGVADASVTAIIKGNDSLGMPVPGYGGQFIAETNDSGYYSLQLPVGSYIVRADAKFYNGIWYIATLSADSALAIAINANMTDTANFALQPQEGLRSCVLSGKVTSHDSAVAGASVTITMVDEDDRADDSLYTVTVTTNAQGQWSDTVTCGARYIIYARMDGFIGVYWKNGHSPLDADRVNVEHSIDGINFVLVRQLNSGTMLSGTVEGCDSARTPLTARVVAYDKLEARFVAVATTETDSLGAYSFTNLAPGTYLIEAIPDNHSYAPGFYTTNNQCTMDWHDGTKIQLLDSAQISGLDIFLHAAERHHGFTDIGGTVVIEGGVGNDVLSGALVLLFDANGNFSDCAVTDANGGFTVAGVDAGAYTLSVESVNYTTVSQGNATTDYAANANPSTQIVAQPDVATGIAGAPVLPPVSATLSQNYPNPFMGTTSFRVNMPANVQPGMVTLGVYDALGRQVADLTAQVRSALANNSTTVTFDASALPAGVYFYRLRVAAGYATAKQMILLH